MTTKLDLWPQTHEVAQSIAEQNFLDKHCRIMGDVEDETERNLRYAFWFGWRHCLKYLRKIEDEQERMVEETGMEAPEFDPDAEYGPPVDQKIVEHIKKGGTLPME